MNNRTFTQDLLGVQNDLLRFAYKLTSDREEANDLLQETSLKALDNEEKYTPDTNFKGWIYRRSGSSRPKRSPRSSGPLSARCWQQPSRKPPSSRNAPKKKSSKGGWNDEA